MVCDKIYKPFVSKGISVPFRLEYLGSDNMAKYILKRVLMALLTIFAIASLTFFLMKAIPGNPFLSEKNPPQSVIDNLNAKYGLDKSVPEQYVMYMNNLIHGDLGVSIKTQKNYPVARIITEMFPTSAKIGAIAISWAVIVGVLLGCISAYYRGKAADSALRVVSTLGISMPGFVVATLLLLLLCGDGKPFPVLFTSTTSWRRYVLPCLALGFYPMSPLPSPAALWWRRSSPSPAWGGTSSRPSPTGTIPSSWGPPSSWPASSSS